MAEVSRADFIVALLRPWLQDERRYFRLYILMRSQLQFWVSVLVLPGFFLSGCSSAPRASSGNERVPRHATRIRAPKTPIPKPEEEIPVKALAHFATGLTFDFNDEPDRALEEYWESAIANPSYEPLVIEVARRMIRAEKGDKAAELLVKATALPGASGTLFAWLGLAYSQAGKQDLAVTANRTAIKKMPQAFPAYQNLVQIYLQNSKTNEAFQVLDEAGRQRGTDAPFLIDLAELYSRYSRVAGGLALYLDDSIKRRGTDLLDRATKLKPVNPIVLQKLADGYVVLGDSDKAEGIYLQLLKTYPDLPVIRGKLTDLYLRSGDKAKAAEQLKAFARDDPTNSRIQAVLGSLALADEKFEEAERYFQSALKLNPQFEQVYYDLAELKLRTKKPKEALDILEKARAKFQLGFAMEYYTAITQAELKQYSEALKYFTSAEVVAKAGGGNALNHVFYYQKGAAYERHGDHQEAEKCFRKCLELSPKYAQALNYLGYMWAEDGVKLDEARTMIEKAVEMEPKNAAFLDSLGWVLFKLNQPTEALTYLVKAIGELKEPDATIYDHLGDVYANLKDYERAREAWRKSLSVEENEQIKRKLDAPPASGRSAP